MVPRVLAALLFALAVLLPSTALADSSPLTQGFERGLGDWQATAAQAGTGWQVVSHPENIANTLAPDLVTLGGPACSDGVTPCLPAAAGGDGAAWFGDPANGSYCSPIAARQHPKDGCTSEAAISGELTSPSFSLAGHASAQLNFDSWFEVEAVNADIADQMSVWYWTPALGWNQATVWPAGDNAAAGLVLNPTDPSWGGGHQPYSDDGARTSGAWHSWVADLSPAAGSAQVRVAFMFNSVDENRNGFRGWLVDNLAVVDALGAPITDNTTSFTDDVPLVSITDLTGDPNDHGSWTVGFHVHGSHPTHDPVTVDWTIHDSHGNGVGHGTATILPGQTDTVVTTDVPGGGEPYTVTLSNPTNGALDPVQSTGVIGGPTLPTLSLGPLTVVDEAPGLVGVTIPVQSDPAVTFNTSVDYNVTGSDGGTLATGTITIPAGSTTGTATVFVAADKLPGSVTLLNPVNAVLATGGAVAPLSAPVGAVASATGGSSPSQLVLGARQTGSGCPCLGKSFLLTLVSGTVRYHQPGKAYQTLASGSVILPFGSVVDATNGHARITVESDDQGNLQSGEFWEGAFGVFQQGVKKAITTLTLARGDFSACPGTSRSHGKRRAARGAAAPKSLRHLWGAAKGNFRTKGRFASATIRGTQWETEDLCLATRISVQQGIVNVFDFRRKTTTPVTTGQSVTVGALQSARYRHRAGLHRPRLASTHG